MKALRYTAIGQEPEVMEVPVPEPGPGEVRVRITAAGACHSDTFVMSLTAEQYEQFGYPLPMTLGHEGVGVVDKLGAGASGIEVGEAVAIYGPEGCGRCYQCAQGKENYCREAPGLGIFPPGLGRDGAMAEYVVVPSPRHLVPLGGLDPVENVALTDAGLTPYHAIKGSLGKLVPGSFAMVIGTGGLGHVAIQVLRAISPATVIAIDVAQSKLDLAKDVGAHHAFLSGDGAAEAVRGVTGPRGVAAIFDFVVAQPTLDLAEAVIGAEGDIVEVGVGATQAHVGPLAAPYDSSIRAPYWGTRSELFEILELARTGAVHVETERFSLDDAPEAYRRLHEGTLRGRAVVVP